MNIYKYINSGYSILRKKRMWSDLTIYWGAKENCSFIALKAHLIIHLVSDVSPKNSKRKKCLSSY